MSSAIWYLYPVVMSDRMEKVGTVIGQQKGLMSSDTAILGPDASGNIYAKAPGVAYLLSLQLYQDGHPIVKGWRVTVIP